MNNFYQQFLRNIHNGIPVEVSLGSENLPATKSPVRMKGEYDTVPHPATVMAYLRLDLPTGRLLIHFLRPSVGAACRTRYFEQSCFMDADLLLSPGVVKALGWVPGEYHLAKGHYPILEDDDFYTVSARVAKPATALPVKGLLPHCTGHDVSASMLAV